MRRVIYVSQSHVSNDDLALAAIVETSSVRNAAAGVTGTLWSGPSEFVQALEGDFYALDETMRRIEADPRHSRIEFLCDYTVQSRMFGAWAMMRSNGGAESIFGTAFLAGFASRQNSAAARRIVDVLSSD